MGNSNQSVFGALKTPYELLLLKKSEKLSTMSSSSEPFAISAVKRNYYCRYSLISLVGIPCNLLYDSTRYCEFALH